MRGGEKMFGKRDGAWGGFENGKREGDNVFCSRWENEISVRAALILSPPSFLPPFLAG